MDIYIAEHAREFEPGWIEGVYSTLERAQKAFPDIESWEEYDTDAWRPATDPNSEEHIFKAELDKSAVERSV